MCIHIYIMYILYIFNYFYVWYICLYKYSKFLIKQLCRHYIFNGLSLNST